MYDDDINLNCFDEDMKNPNLYITMESMGGFFSSNVYPFLEINPFTLNAPN